MSAHADTHDADHAKRESTGTGFASDMESLKKSFAALRTDLMQLIDRGLVAGKSSAHHAVDGVKDAASGLKDKGADSVQAVEDHISEHPVASTVIAFAVGYVLGKLFSRR
jgi:ElaB/YqjD/DUF883 family membrane-anchored ribosome-binding protein